MWFDLRFAVRKLLAQPAASLAVIAILACAIAVATVLGALFAATIDDVPPVDQPDRVGHVWLADETMPTGHRPPSIADYVAWKDGATTLIDVAAVATRSGILGGAADAQDIGVAIISDRLWRQRFGGDPAIIGRHIRVDVHLREVVGVMLPAFWFPYRSGDVWLPFGGGPHDDLDVVARLRPGRTWDDARAELDVLTRTRTLVRSLPQEAAIRIGPGIAALLAPALAILFIACANVGNLLIMRLATREKEFGIRAARPWQLATLAMQRDAPLVAAGVAAGAGGTVWVTAIVWRDLLLLNAVDPRAWIGTAAIVGLAALLASVGPAIRAARVDPVALLRAE